MQCTDVKAVVAVDVSIHVEAVVLFLNDAIVLVGKEDRSLLLPGFSVEERGSLGLCLSDDHGDTLFHDARFFGCNLFQRVALELCMVKTDVGDDFKQRSDDIRRVEPATHAHLDDGEIYGVVISGNTIAKT